MKRFFTALMTGLAAVIAIVSCEQPQEQEITVTQVNVTPASLALTEGETASLRAEVLPSDATNRSVAWTSSAPAVASVSDAGTVTAVAPGTATITATAGGKKGSCTVVVSAKVVEVESITLSAIELEIERGATAELKATVNPPGATFGEIVWSSSDEAVAKVAGGVLTAVGPGSATVTATVNGKSAACDVTVVVSLRAAEIEVPSYRLVEGQSQEVNIVLTPADATGVVITWASSDNSVVTVENGVMEAVGPGSATITVTINGTETKFAMVVEKKVIPVSEVTVDKPEVTLVEGESTLVTATVAPADATDPAVTWTSLNPEVAGVADGLITARKPGKATITAKAGDKLATCVVTVEKKFVPVATVTLNRTDMALVEGETGSLTATVGPSDATDPTVVWASTNPGIASVAGGVVTAVSPGTATITATAGDVTAACEVSVSKKFIPVSEISLDFTELPLTKGQTATLKATVGPA
ncbi:MAG: Ig domain-containing protein, partial [Bacteroidales bacterium]|nr:Ig domain-containing protein [Bacteroidales bacterium]